MSDDSASDTASDTTTSSRDSESGSPDPGHDTPPISVNASRRGTGYSVSAYPRAGRALSGALRASFAATTNDLSALPGAPKDATSKSLQFAVPGAPGSAGGRPETGSSSPERLALSPTDTAFITSINLEDKKDDKEFNNERMLAPPVLQFPGLDPASNRVPMVFPGNIPVKAAITHTLKLQGKWMSGKITNVVVRTLQNPLTQRILTAAFWHVVLTHFQDRSDDPEIEMLYNHIAEDYGNLFISLGVGDAGQQDANKSLGGGTGSKAAYDPRAFLRKDRILEWYPDLCSQVIYSVCTTLFARATMTKMSLGQEFKEHLLRQLHTWLSGVPPTTVTLKHWPAHYLNPIDLNAQKLKKKKSKSNKNNNFFSESGSGSFGHATPTSGATTVSPKETPKTSAKAEGKTEADAKAEKTKKAPLDKTQQSHRAKTRWKQAAKAALVESTTHEIVSAFQELGAAAKAREQRLQKAIEQNRRNDRKIVPQLTFAEQNWYETGRAQSPRSVLPGAKAAEDMNEKVGVRFMSLGERSPMIERYMDSKRITHAPSTRQKLAMAMPNKAQSLNRPIVYQPVAQASQQKSQEAREEYAVENQRFEMAKAEEVSMYRSAMNKFDREKRMYLKMLALQHSSKSTQVAEVVNNTKKMLADAEAERTKPLVDPSDICTRITRYAVITTFVAKYLHEFPSYERAYLVESLYRVHRRVQKLQIELEKRGQQEVGFLSKIQSFEDIRGLLSDFMPTSVLDDMLNAEKRDKELGVGRHVMKRKNGMPKGWEGLAQMTVQEVDSENMPETDGDGPESSEAALQPRPPSGKPPRARGQLLKTEMQKRQLNPVLINPLPPLDLRRPDSAPRRHFTAHHENL